MSSWMCCVTSGIWSGSVIIRVLLPVPVAMSPSHMDALIKWCHAKVSSCWATWSALSIFPAVYLKQPAVSIALPDSHISVKCSWNWPTHSNIIRGHREKNLKSMQKVTSLPVTFHCTSSNTKLFPFLYFLTLTIYFYIYVFYSTLSSSITRIFKMRFFISCCLILTILLI